MENKEELLKKKIEIREQLSLIEKELDKINYDERYSKSMSHVGKFYKELGYHEQHHSYHHVKALSVSYWDEKDTYYEISTTGHFHINSYDDKPFEEIYTEVSKEEFETAINKVKSLIKIL